MNLPPCHQTGFPTRTRDTLHRRHANAASYRPPILPICFLRPDIRRPAHAPNVPDCILECATGLPSRADVRRPISRISAELAIPISIFTAIRGTWRRSDPTIHRWLVMDCWRWRSPIDRRWRDILDGRGIVEIVIAIVIAPIPHIPSNLLPMGWYHPRAEQRSRSRFASCRHDGKAGSEQTNHPSKCNTHVELRSRKNSVMIPPN